MGCRQAPAAQCVQNAQDTSADSGHMWNTCATSANKSQVPGCEQLTAVVQEPDTALKLMDRLWCESSVECMHYQCVLVQPIPSKSTGFYSTCHADTGSPETVTTQYALLLPLLLLLLLLLLPYILPLLLVAWMASLVLCNAAIARDITSCDWHCAVPLAPSTAQ